MLAVLGIVALIAGGLALIVVCLYFGADENGN